METATVGAQAAAQAGSKTVADLLPLAARRHGTRDAVWNSDGPRKPYESLPSDLPRAYLEIEGMGRTPSTRDEIDVFLRYAIAFFRCYVQCDQAFGATLRRVPFDDLVPGPRTRIVFCSHVEWTTGRVNDVAAICDAARTVVRITCNGSPQQGINTSTA